MKTSSNKQARLHSRKPVNGSKGGKLERETESPLIVAQNNIIRTNIKAKIDYTLQNSK